MISDIVGRCLAACRAVLGSSKTCVLAFSLVCVSVAPASAQLERRFIRSGNKSYERADYDKASENYVKALDKNKESIEAIANMGNVLYKQDNFEAAGEIFSRLAESETDTLLKAGDYYNLGNNLFKQRRFEEALEAYKNALRLDPSDADAKFNLAYTRKMLDKDRNDNGGGGGSGGDNKDDENDNGGNNDDNRNEGNDDDRQDNENRDGDNKSDDSRNDDRRNDNGDDSGSRDASGAMSRKEAEQLLDLMQAEENRTSEKVDRDKAGAVGVRGGKNW